MRSWALCSVLDQHRSVENWEVETENHGLGEEVEDIELGQQL